MNSNFEPILHEVDFLFAEAATLRAIGPRLRILYRLSRDGTEVAMVSLVHRSRLYHLRLATRARVLVGHLAKHRLPQSAAQIQTSIRLSHVKVYIKRVREALARAFRDAGMDSADPYRVLVSEPTDGKTVLYTLRCSVEWLHESLPPGRPKEIGRAANRRPTPV